MATDAGEALINKEKEKVIRQRAQTRLKRKSRNQSRDDYTGGSGMLSWEKAEDKLKRKS